MSYGLNFGFTTMPMMNYTMPMGSGIQSDNWQYSYFAGPGKSSISYPVDQMSVMNDMALKNYVDNTYNLVPQMMNFMNQMQAKFQQWYNQMQMEMQKRMEEANEAKIRQQAEQEAAQNDGNIDPTHDDEKVKPEEQAPTEETPEAEEPAAVEEPAVTEEPQEVDETPAVEEPTETEETPEVEDPDNTEKPAANGDRSYRGTLEDKSTFDEKNDNIAKELYSSMKGPGTWTRDFDHAMHKISAENVVEVMEGYRENYAPQMKEFGFFGTKDFNLIDSIVGDFSGKDLVKNVKYIGNALIERAKALTDKKDKEGNIIEDPKVTEFKEQLKNFEEVYDEENKKELKYKFEDFKDWIRELEGTKNKRIIMDTNADTTAA